MRFCFLRYVALPCVMLVLAECAGHEDRAVRTPTTDSENMRVVMGEVASTVAPLTPEPGDIWSDLAFLKPWAAPSRVTTASRSTAPPLPSTLTPAPSKSDEQAVTTLERPMPSAAQPHLQVQLVAASSEQAARAQWQKLQRRMSDLIGGHEPLVTAAEVEGREVWRLRISGFATVADATTFCGQLQSRQASCWVVALPGS
jgi:hypothetical protein